MSTEFKLSLFKLFEAGATVDAIQKFVETGEADLNECDKNGTPAAYYAIDMHLDDVAIWLIEAGAPVDEGVVYAAAQNGAFDILKMLIEKRGQKADPYLEDVGGFSPLLVAFSEAANHYRTNIEVFKKVGDKKVQVTDPDEVDRIAGPNRFGNFYKIVEYLLSLKANPNQRTIKNRQTALHYVGDKGDILVDMAKLILEAGADPNLEDAFGMTGLHFAARRGNLAIVELFLQYKADVNIQENYGFTALHEAVENNRKEVAELLLQYGADMTLGLTKKFDPYKKGDMPKDIAKEKGLDEMVALIEKWEARPNQ